jgi:hypothetical protein
VVGKAGGAEWRSLTTNAMKVEPRMLSGQDGLIAAKQLRALQLIVVRSFELRENPLMWLLWILGGFYGLAAIVWAIDRIKKIPVDVKEKKQVEHLEKDIKQREVTLQRERAHFEELKEESGVALERISKKKALGFPWLATAYSEYLKLYELKLANELEDKKHPARRAAEEAPSHVLRRRGV